MSTSLQVIYERGNLSAGTLKIINTYLPAAIKEALHKEGQFWSSSKVLKVCIYHLLLY